MSKKLKVTKVNKKTKTITVDTDYNPTYIKPVNLPIWAGKMYTLDELFQITKDGIKEELEKKYPKGSA